ncbi:alpha/beta fold hydrolase [Massilia sp. CCM 8733]|uniref:Alpha/beta fold hydrolase n=1 Tax=Massilia mucilaginosa TaxID=2609282 RepID=A0ABX0NZD7_9BURK|nr:alpha/beta hydrolase [Massilia mucilaginosa]NHZ92363.1 alpha/beta fold hydrolase [Massilia mucilaginosa]
MPAIGRWKWNTCLLFAVCVGAAASEQAIELRTGSGALAGTLSLPKASGPVPVALIIAGSGPTDRDGNAPGMKNDSLRLLAQGLADAGVASVRFDKRGVAASVAAVAKEADLRFDTYIDDATAWLAMLKADKRFSHVSVVGHSEGALIGMLAAKAGDAKAYVSIAGVARGASTVLREQLATALPAPLDKESERILAELEAGREAVKVPPELATLYRPSVQPYLISWFRYVPATAIKDLKMPVLLVQGSTDLQVAVSEAGLLHKAKPDAQLVVVKGMNHVLKEAPPDKASQTPMYIDPKFPLAPTLVPAVAGFLNKVSKETQIK